jgi:hypothetical protein
VNIASVALQNERLLEMFFYCGGVGSAVAVDGGGGVDEFVGVGSDSISQHLPVSS